MDDCIFCKIARHEIPARIVFEDDSAVAFHDVHPQAPTHILVVPRKHLASLNECDSGDEALLGHLLAVTRQLAQSGQVHSGGYRIVLNTGPDAGQTVFHLHFHLMGGRPFAWPPG